MFHRKHMYAKRIALLLMSFSSAGSLFSADELLTSLQQTSSRWGAFSDRMSDFSDTISGGFKKISKGFTGYLSKSKLKWNSLTPKTKFGIKLGAVAAGTLGLGAAATYFYNLRHVPTARETGLILGAIPEVEQRMRERQQAARREELNQIDTDLAYLQDLPDVDEHSRIKLGSLRRFVRTGQVDVALEIVRTLKNEIATKESLKESLLAQESVIISRSSLSAGSSDAMPIASDIRSDSVSARLIAELTQIETQLNFSNEICNNVNEPVQPQQPDERTRRDQEGVQSGEARIDSLKLVIGDATAQLERDRLAAEAHRAREAATTAASMRNNRDEIERSRLDMQVHNAQMAQRIHGMKAAGKINDKMATQLLASASRNGDKSGQTVSGVMNAHDALSGQIGFASPVSSAAASSSTNFFEPTAPAGSSEPASPIASLSREAVSSGEASPENPLNRGNELADDMREPTHDLVSQALDTIDAGSNDTEQEGASQAPQAPYVRLADQLLSKPSSEVPSVSPAQTTQRVIGRCSKRPKSEG